MTYVRLNTGNHAFINGPAILTDSGLMDVFQEINLALMRRGIKLRFLHCQGPLHD